MTPTCCQQVPGTVLCASRGFRIYNYNMIYPNFLAVDEDLTSENPNQAWTETQDLEVLAFVEDPHPNKLE
ncbi:hypothetical protein V6N13_003145 [Hibiscus sabdariffa]